MTTSTRAAGTRQSLLSAARSVFAESGFAEASIAEVVSRASASVGSLYHHFGGKAELYIALFEEYQTGQEARAAASIREARTVVGETDPMALFVVGSRSYLNGCWEQRDLARMFLAGGGPPGFESLSRKRYREWTRRNAALLGTEGPWGEALVLVLTTVISEAGHEVAVCEDERAAQRLLNNVLGLVEKIGR